MKKYFISTSFSLLVLVGTLFWFSKQRPLEPESKETPTLSTHYSSTPEEKTEAWRKILAELETKETQIQNYLKEVSNQKKKAREAIRELEQAAKVESKKIEEAAPKMPKLLAINSQLQRRVKRQNFFSKNKRLPFERVLSLVQTKTPGLKFEQISTSQSQLSFWAEDYLDTRRSPRVSFIAFAPLALILDKVSNVSKVKFEIFANPKTQHVAGLFHDFLREYFSLNNSQISLIVEASTEEKVKVVATFEHFGERQVLGSL